MPLPSVEQESDLPISLSQHLTPYTSLPKDVTEVVLLYAYPPAPFDDSCEFGMGE